MSSFIAEDVLEALDRAAEDFVFPMLDNGYYYPVDVRLRAFADDRRWLLVFETVGYGYRIMNLSDVVTTIGVTDGGTAQADIAAHLDRLDNCEDLVADEDEISAGAPLPIVRGQALSVPLVVGEPIWNLCRRLVPEHRELLLMSPDELAAFHPADLPLLLTLDEWWHPDLAGGEVPSGTDTFKQIAEVVATQDPGRYHPTQPANTHWSNWPDGGNV